MTLEEACTAAEQLLEQRGTLINSHLLRLVSGDKAMFRLVREFLIREGIAEDRAGVGLSLAEVSAIHENAGRAPIEISSEIQPDRPQSAPRHQVPEPIESEWWIMSAGRQKGPFDFDSLCKLRMNGDILPGDVVRRGSTGLWRQPDDVPALAQLESVPVSSPIIERVNFETEIFVPPEKGWSLGKQARPTLWGGTWQSVATIVGGSRTLKILLVIAVIVGAFTYWWRQPPPTEIILKEFDGCYAALQRLRERRKPRADWTETIDHYHPRIQGIVDRLRYRNADVDKALYQAGTYGLLPLLNVPSDITEAERLYEQNIELAKRFFQKKQ